MSSWEKYFVEDVCLAIKWYAIEQYTLAQMRMDKAHNCIEYAERLGGDVDTMLALYHETLRTMPELGRHL